MAKGILEDVVKVIISWLWVNKKGDCWDITEVGPCHHINHLKAVFSDWQHKGKSRNSKHQKDSLCHCHITRWRWPHARAGSQEWHLSWEPARRRGPWSYNCKEPNFAKGISEWELFYTAKGNQYNESPSEEICGAEAGVPLESQRPSLRIKDPVPLRL